MVVIKDMEMPSCCYECPYGHCVGSFSFCSIIGDDEIDIQEDYLAGTRYEYCPLVDKVGTWIDCGFVDKGSFKRYKCSNCSDFVYDKEYLIKYHKYCLHCGAKMVDTENE